MDESSKVSCSCVPTTPTLEIVTSVIFPPGVSNIMTSVVNSTISTSISSIYLLFIDSFPSISGSISFFSMSNDFSINMSSMGMLNTLTCSQLRTQVSNIGGGISLISYKLIPWRSHSSIISIHWEKGFTVFRPKHIRRLGSFHGFR